MAKISFGSLGTKDFKKIIAAIFILLLLLSPLALYLNDAFHYSEFKPYFVVSLKNESEDYDWNALFDTLVKKGDVAKVNRNDRSVTFQNISVDAVDDNVKSSINEDGTTYELTHVISAQSSQDVFLLLMKLLGIFALVLSGFIFYLIIYPNNKLKLAHSVYLIAFPLVATLGTLLVQVGFTSLLSRVFMIRLVDLTPFVLITVSTFIFYLISIFDYKDAALKSIRQLNDKLGNYANQHYPTLIKISMVILPVVTIGLGVKAVVTMVLLFISIWLSWMGTLSFATIKPRTIVLKLNPILLYRKVKANKSKTQTKPTYKVTTPKSKKKKATTKSVAKKKTSRK